VHHAALHGLNLRGGLMPVNTLLRQGPTITAHAPGSGIGLALVVRFAEMHGGRAWVQERPGGGASFRVFLPDVRDPDGVTPPPLLRD
jgi:light-regulated signal transduction histidine kinase (bacteriophytochrome)